MKKGFVLSIDVMIAAIMFVTLLYAVNSNSQTSQSTNRELIVRESAYITASDCLFMAESEIASKDIAIINRTLNECTERKTNVRIEYYGNGGEVLQARNFNGTESVSSRRVITIMDGSKAMEFVIAMLEVET